MPFSSKFDDLLDFQALNNNAPWLDNPHWANERQFPHHVVIQSHSPRGGRPLVCSGALIDFSWVLTTASCVIRGQVFSLRIGTITHYANGETRDSFNIHIHPFYNHNNNTNDAALIRLPVSVSGINNTVIALPKAAMANKNWTSSLAVVSGYGIDSSNDLSPVLTFSYAQIINTNSDECRRHTRLPVNQITQQLRCANIFVRQSFNQRCFGDRGSPLIIFYGSRWLLIGLSIHHSREIKCKQSTNLYTDVGLLRAWILRITNLKFP